MFEWRQSLFAIVHISWVYLNPKFKMQPSSSFLSLLSRGYLQLDGDRLSTRRLDTVSTEHERPHTDWLDTRWNERRVDSIRVELCAVSTRHEQNWALSRLGTATLVTTGRQRTMHRIDFAQTTQRESTVHHCNCAPVATRSGCNSRLLQLDTVATQHDRNMTRLQVDTAATRHHSYCLCIRIQNDRATSRLLLKSTLIAKRIVFVVNGAQPIQCMVLWCPVVTSVAVMKTRVQEYKRCRTEACTKMLKILFLVGGAAIATDSLYTLGKGTRTVFQTWIS